MDRKVYKCEDYKERWEIITSEQANNCVYFASSNSRNKKAVSTIRDRRGWVVARFVRFVLRFGLQELAHTPDNRLLT